jgi:hypothetical protein
MDLVEGQASSETEKEIVQWVGAGYAGAPATRRDTDATVVKRVREPSNTLDDGDKPDGLKTYQETARDELVLRMEQMWRLENEHRGRNRTAGRKRTPTTDVGSTALGRKGDTLLGCSGRNSLEEGPVWRVCPMRGRSWRAQTSNHARNNRSTSVYCSLPGHAGHNDFVAQRRDLCYALIGKHVSITEAEFSVRVRAEAI